MEGRTFFDRSPSPPLTAMVIPMTAPRLDFKRLRAEADFSAVLASYDIEMKKDGTRPGQFKALCPFHDDKDPSLKINTDKNIFHCFVCEAKGNVRESLATDLNQANDAVKFGGGFKPIRLTGELRSVADRFAGGCLGNGC